jgi:hypothetical protein
MKDCFIGKILNISRIKFLSLQSEMLVKIDISISLLLFKPKKLLWKQLFLILKLSDFDRFKVP